MVKVQQFESLGIHSRSSLMALILPRSPLSIFHLSPMGVRKVVSPTISHALHVTLSWFHTPPHQKHIPPATPSENHLSLTYSTMSHHDSSTTLLLPHCITIGLLNALPTNNHSTLIWFSRVSIWKIMVCAIFNRTFSTFKTYWICHSPFFTTHPIALFLFTICLLLLIIFHINHSQSYSTTKLQQKPDSSLFLLPNSLLLKHFPQ